MSKLVGGFVRRVTVGACVAVPTAVFAPNPAQAGPLEDAVDALEAAFDELGFCPGLDLAFTCGNGTCDWLLGENASVCKADCLPALVKAYYAQATACDQVQTVFEPQSVFEVQEAVRQSIVAGRRVRVVGSVHSATDVLCTDGATIKTHRLAQILGLGTIGSETVVSVRPGATLKSLTEYLHGQNLTIGYSPTGMNLVTVAGALATGSHGSATAGGASLASRVREVDVVLPDGELVTYDESDGDAFKAAVVHLGLLGVVTRVSLAVEPQFSVAARVDHFPAAQLFAPGGLSALTSPCEWVYLSWFPGQNKVMRMCGNRTSAPNDPGAANDLISPDVPAILQMPFVAALQGGACDGEFGCLFEAVRYAMLQSQPPFVKSNGSGGEVHVSQVVGPSHKIVTAALPPEQVKFSQTDWELAIPGAEAEAALQTLASIIGDAEACMPIIGVIMRMDRVDDSSLLGGNASGDAFADGEPVLYVEMPVFLPFAFDAARLDEFEGPFEDIAVTMMDQHGARAHWGKNQGFLFAEQLDAGTHDEGQMRFQAVLEATDPFGVFSNAFAARAGFSWPQLGQDFSNHYYPGSNACGCGVNNAQVCDRQNKVTYTNACRAACAGAPASRHLQGSCDEYRFTTIKILGITWKAAYRYDSLLPTAVWR